MPRIRPALLAVVGLLGIASLGLAAGAGATTVTVPVDSSPALAPAYGRPVIPGQEVNPLVSYVEVGSGATVAAVPGVVVHINRAADETVTGWTATAPSCDLIASSAVRVTASGQSEHSAYLTEPGTNRTVVAYTGTADVRATTCGMSGS